MKKLLTVVLSLVASLATALYEQEIGLNDFTISTTGHGIPANAFATDTIIITSDNACSVASRSLETGELKWRRHVCSSTSRTHNIQSSGAFFYTTDEARLLRGWVSQTGALAWEAKLPIATPNVDTATGHPTLLGITAAGPKTILSTKSGDGSSLYLYNAVNGRPLGNVNIKDVADAGPGSVWLSVVSGDHGAVTALIGAVDENGYTKGDLFTTVLSFQVSPQGEESIMVGATKELSHVRASFLASSLKVRLGFQESMVLAISDTGRFIYFSISSTDLFQVVDLKGSLWASVESLEVLAGGVIRVAGRDDKASSSKSLFQYKDNTWFELADPSSQNDDIAYCEATNLLVTSSKGIVRVYDSMTASVSLTPVVTLDSFPDVAFLEAVTCESSAMFILVSTSKLSTTMVKITAESTKTVWTTEDGISTVTSALLLDTGVALLQDETTSMSKVSFSARLEAQLNTGMEFFAHLMASETRDEDFGFVKLAILLSKKLKRIWAVPTVGKNRGIVTWALDLPQDASWHTMVHGTSNSASLIHGINGGTHSPEVLVLSSRLDETLWTCLDGATGAVHAAGSVPSSAPVTQVIPIVGGGLCRQVALLIHSDFTLSVVPDDDKSKAAVIHEIHKGQNGFYGHTINRDASTIETFTLQSTESGLQAHRIGLTGFPGEKIVKIAYPVRDEVVQSPCSVLGDDSILLKYINPHMAVILTAVDEDMDVKLEKDPLIMALKAEKKPTTTTRKPKGVSQPDNAAGEPGPSDDSPNLFVNIVDTVSSRLLHRISHANAAVDWKLPVLINENWIVYAFFNKRSRRTELGVLSLYEGMIDKAGITAFTSPEQVLTFSSFEPRESTPVVLSKTYTIVKPVTALGVTATRAGISTRQILIASADDRITAVSRPILEPRRPLGKLKPHEKAEGMFEYSPLLPLISSSSPSYNQTIHGVTTIISSATALESQSLILAFGGPDVFFARISPSNGFDLLPESFSRTLLSIVVVGLLAVFLVVKYMAEKKLAQGLWA